MKKKIAKIGVLVCALALVLAVTAALTACGTTGTTYNYSGVNIESEGSTGSMGGMFDSMNAVYDTMYKNSTLTVNESQIVWHVTDADYVMTVNKDGDRYVLFGDYVDSMRDAFLSMGVSVNEYEMYGLQTESGFEIIMEYSMSMSTGVPVISIGVAMTYSFVK